MAFLPDLSDLTPENLLFNMVVKLLAEYDGYVRSLELVGCEVPLAKAGDSTIRADFFAIFPGEPGLTILELKKSGQTERQAFTELLAYGNHTSSVFPFMSRDDTRYVLIAPLVERIVREAVLHTLVVEGEFIYTLIPYFQDDNDIKTLRLKPWIPDIADITALSTAAFNPNNFRVFKQVWEHEEGHWNGPPQQPVPNSVVHRMDMVSTYAAQIMEERRIHGFVYTSQHWSELHELLPYTNSLVIVGLNPFKIAYDLELIDGGIPPDELPSVIYSGVNLMTLFPGLSANAKDIHDEINYLDYLIRCWDAHIMGVSDEVIRRSLQSTGGSLGVEHGLFNWEDYQGMLIEDAIGENFAVRPTGLIRKLYWDTTWEDYQVARRVGIHNHPVQGDLYKYAAETLSSQYFFRFFLRRMFGDNEP